MKKYILTLAAVLLCTAAFAQNTLVKGIVVDSSTGEPESYAVIQFLDKSDKVAAFTMTDENGAFKQNLPAGKDYTMYFTNVGRKDVRIPFKTADKEFDLGTIPVEFDIEALKGATVVAQESLVQMDVDKMSYKVADDVDAKTSTVLDMLRKVPMVTVDGQDNISVNGSSNFQVLVDGKPNPMFSANASDIFKVMPASTVKKIDVITNPGVKYDAEGVGGVLNIITNKEVTGGASAADGQYGTVRLQGGTRGIGGGIFYNAQQGKWSFGVNANANNRNSPGTVTDDERIQQTAAGQTITNNHSETKLKTPMAMINLNAGYELNDLNTFSATIGYMRFGMGYDGLSTMNMLLPDGTKYGYEGNTLQKNNRNSLSATFDWQHSWADKPERMLVISYQFSGSPSINNSTNSYGGAVIPGFDLTDRKTTGGSNSLNNIFQADFTTPLGGRNTLNAGLKFQNRHNSSEQTNYLWNGSDFIETPVGSLDYHFRNNIGAAYVEYEGKFGSFGLKAGMRYEHTWQNVNYLKGEGEDFSLQYGNLVPTASIQYSISRTQNIGLSYNMRISRPGITYLNPYVDITNPFAISYGNTNLKTETTHNINLVYNIYTPKFMMNNTLGYSMANGGIASYSFYDENNVMNTTYGNIVNNRSIGLNSYMMITPGKTTRIIVNGGTRYNNMSSEMLNQSNAGWSYNVMLGIQQTIPWDLRLSANVITSGSTVTLQGHSDGIALAMGGITKSFFGDKLSISINGTCGLKDFNNIVITNVIEGAGFSSKTVSKVPMSQVQVGLSWTFGKQTMKMQKRSVRRSSDDEINTQNISESMGSMMNNF